MVSEQVCWIHKCLYNIKLKRVVIMFYFLNCQVLMGAEVCTKRFVFNAPFPSL